MKVFIYSENLSEPFDEGIKKTAFHIINGLSKITTVFVACRNGKKFKETFMDLINSNRLLISFKLRKRVKNFDPDIIVYIPRWCGTFASFVRMKILNIYNQRSNSVMVILQPKKISRLQEKLIRFLKPNKVYTPSPEVLEQMSELEIHVEFLPLFVDREQFKPIENLNKKSKLREKYGLPLEKFIILHVGHINSGRNLEALVPLQKNNNQVVIVGSSSTTEVAYKDEVLKGVFKEKGIIVIDNYIDNIEEIYQLSDIYIFPTTFSGGCIGIPLSVLEARACGLPIITTNFGGLKRILSYNYKDFIYSKPENFLKNINKMKMHLGTLPNNDDLERINNLFHISLLKMLEK